MILSIRLDDSNTLGVNFELLQDRSNIRLVSGELPTFADLQDGDGLKIGFLDASLASFLEALETIGDTNVVATPTLMCLNKQRAEILIGSELGYVSTTVTENAATQAIEFLEVGTQLRIRPFIAEDGTIRMEIHPELSTGNVRVEAGFTLPDKEVTQVTTNVMCHDGSTIIIGGLIREDITATGSQIPLLGSMPIIGPAFREMTEQIDRREIVVLITPRIVVDSFEAKRGSETADLYLHRQDIYADKMSPIGKRFYGRYYMRQSRSAWAAGDANAALRYANLSLHFDPLSRESIELRDEIMAMSSEGDRTIHSHLREGLFPHQHPKVDYSRRGCPWESPQPDNTLIPVGPAFHDMGVPGHSTPIKSGATEYVPTPQGTPVREPVPVTIAPPIPNNTSSASHNWRPANDRRSGNDKPVTIRPALPITDSLVRPASYHFEPDFGETINGNTTR